MEESEWCVLGGVETEEETINQGMWAAFRSWKTQGNKTCSCHILKERKGAIKPYLDTDLSVSWAGVRLWHLQKCL
jgi:hypothetical protein